MVDNKTVISSNNQGLGLGFRIWGLWFGVQRSRALLDGPQKT